MRGLKSVSAAAIFARGHALIRNIRRGFYRVVESVPHRLVFKWTWNRLAEAVQGPQAGTWWPTIDGRPRRSPR